MGTFLYYACFAIGIPFCIGVAVHEIADFLPKKVQQFFCKIGCHKEEFVYIENENEDGSGKLCLQCIWCKHIYTPKPMKKPHNCN